MKKPHIELYQSSKEESLTCRIVFHGVHKNRHPCLLTCMKDAVRAIYGAYMHIDMSDIEKE
jgi:hypothetical protein